MPSTTESSLPDSLRNAPRSQPAKRTQQPVLSTGIPDSTIRAAEAEKVAAESQLWETVRKRRFKARAIGITVLVAACAILGAQLKSVKQETDKFKQVDPYPSHVSSELALTTDKSTTNEIALGQRQSKVHTNLNHSTLANEPTTRTAPYSIDVVRQIALLEDRKALLNRERSNLEQKIEMLRERRARKREIEARRAGSGLNK